MALNQNIENISQVYVCNWNEFYQYFPTQSISFTRWCHQLTSKGTVYGIKLVHPVLIFWTKFWEVTYQNLSHYSVFISRIIKTTNEILWSNFLFMSSRLLILSPWIGKKTKEKNIEMHIHWIFSKSESDT